MKKVLFLFALFIFIFFPFKAYASAVGTAITAMIYQQQIVQWLMDMGYQIKQAAEDAMSVYHLYEQVQHWVRNEERYLKNLRSIMDVRSFQDFMGWFNRSMYIARESERIYSDMGVNIGGKKYYLSEIDEIPEAVRNEYIDRNWDNISEEERYKIWTKLGLAPSNYFYMKTWQNRNEEIKKRLLTSREMHLDEMEDAAARNNDLLAQYSESSDDIDSNTIAKNSGASLAQIEMALRELTVTTDDLMAYIASRDEANKFIPNSYVPYENWNLSLYKRLTDTSFVSNFED